MAQRRATGFDKIREACAKYDAPLPEYDISDVGVMVLCKPCERYLRLLRCGESVTSNDRYMTDILTDREAKNMAAILDYLKDNASISNEKGRQLTGKSAATVKRYLKRLSDIGVLEQTGSNKNTLYIRVITIGQKP